MPLIDLISEITISATGLELAARVWGPEDGEPVLALHGWLDNAASFDRLAALLPSKLRIVALDLPGHGLSEHRPPGCAYHFVDWVAVVLGVADALGWERFSILGHSMGAAMSALVAGTAVDRIERMAWIDGLGPWALPADQAPAQLARSIEEHRVLETKSPRKMADLDEALKVLGHAYSDLSPGSLRVLLDRGLRKTTEGVEFRYDLKLRAASPMRLTEEQVLAFLEAITCPVLLVRPRQGWPLDVEMMSRRVAAVPELAVLEIDGGHHVHIEHPDRLSDAVGDFLGAIET